MTSPSQPQTQPQGTKPAAAPPPVAPVAPVAPVVPVAALPPLGAGLAAGGAALISSITVLLASGYGAAMLPALIVARLVKWGILLAVARWVVAASGRRPGGMPSSIGVASKAVRTAEYGYRASYI